MKVARDPPTGKTGSPRLDQIPYVKKKPTTATATSSATTMVASRSLTGVPSKATGMAVRMMASSVAQAQPRR